MKTFKQFNEARLSAAQRRALPDKDFALPGKGEGPKGKQAGSYPIPDEKHARSALSLVSQHGTPEEKAKVRAKVAKKFPGIQQEALAPSKQELNIMKKVNLLQLRLQKEKKKTTQKAAQAAKQQDDVPVQQESVEQIDEVQVTKLGNAQQKAMVDAVLKRKEELKKKEKVKKEEVQIEAKAKYDNTKSPDYTKKKKALAKKHGGEENIKGHPQYEKYDPMEDPTFDPIEAERTRGVSGKDNPKGGKKLKKIVKQLSKEDKAFDTVVANLRKQHGKDSVITKDNPPKPPTEAQKKAYAAHRAKIAAQDTRDDLEKSSQGRYSRKYSNVGSD